MPIEFDRADIEAFFNARMDDTFFPDSGREQYWLDYSGQLLKYSIIIDVEREAVMISGDPDTPWGAQSMYEIGVPCTSILVRRIGRDEGVTFACYYGDTSDRRNRTLAIIKRPDSDLIVWPSWTYPAGHPYSNDVIDTDVEHSS